MWVCQELDTSPPRVDSSPSTSTQSTSTQPPSMPEVTEITRRTGDRDFFNVQEEDDPTTGVRHSLFALNYTFFTVSLNISQRHDVMWLSHANWHILIAVSLVWLLQGAPWGTGWQPPGRGFRGFRGTRLPRVLPPVLLQVRTHSFFKNIKDARRVSLYAFLVSLIISQRHKMFSHVPIDTYLYQPVTYSLKSLSCDSYIVS